MGVECCEKILPDEEEGIKRIKELHQLEGNKLSLVYVIKYFSLLRRFA